MELNKSDWIIVGLVLNTLYHIASPETFDVESKYIYVVQKNVKDLLNFNNIFISFKNSIQFGTKHIIEEQIIQKFIKQPDSFYY